ncbi:MAG: hypothetical protein JSV09_13350 [Thermoplasmata archaeon]|nr:MAG: hypothetical protein JSV09_13350 [Thermoplasmata archaeon]
MKNNTVCFSITLENWLIHFVGIAKCILAVEIQSIQSQDVLAKRAKKSGSKYIGNLGYKIIPSPNFLYQLPFKEMAKN